MKKVYTILVALILLLCLEFTLSCQQCEWESWTQIGECSPGCKGSQMRMRRTPCCGDNEGELDCFQRCGKALSDGYKYTECREGLKGLSKRSIGSNAKKCVPVDLMFIMDESGSIGSANFEKMRTFAIDLVNQLNIGSGEAMISFLTYSDHTRVKFDFNTYNTKSQVTNGIQNIVYSSGGTNTADALQTAKTHYSSAYGKRSNALSLAIVLTDGRSNDKSATTNAAYALLNHGVTVYCIGIGSNVDMDELKAIASNPNDDYLITSSDFDQLTTKITGLVQSLCIDDVFPHFITCHMEIQDNNGERAQSSGASSACSDQLDFYGKYQVHKAITNVTVDADNSKLTAPPTSSDFAYGITDAKVQMIKKSLSGSEVELGVDWIKSDPNILQKPDTLLSKDIAMTASHTLVNGDRFCLRYSADAGGYVTYQGRKYTYAKTNSRKDLCYYFDYVAPKHCKDLGTCTNEPLILSEEITRNKNITVSFSGWDDPYPTGGTPVFASGIKSYELYLYEMIDGAPGKLKMDTTSLINTVKCTCPMYEISLPDSTHPALYAVVLEVVDIALNVRQARRFVFRDDVSKLTVHPHNPFVTYSASDKTNLEWQINHNDLCFNWTDRFYNDKMVHFNPLNPIEPDPHGLFQGIYEQTNGAIPQSGTINVHGITTFKFSLSRDGVTFISNRTITNILPQTHCVSSSEVAPLDGQTFVFTLFMEDLVKHSYLENTTVYVDASVAEVIEIALTKEGRKQLYVHDSTDLSKMNLEFTAFDPHSGLYSVEWFIGTTDDGLHFGYGALGVHSLNIGESCQASVQECICPSVGPCQYNNFTINLNSLIANNTHTGKHNRDYFFEIKVTNKAQLVVTERIDILVDDSPPEAGVVAEGSPGDVDIDYAGSKDILVNWNGFIDHESGIKLYYMGISSSCLSENITSAEIFQELDGDVTDFRATVKNEGKYFVTIIAYNNAFMPSKPVCSDGITIDLSPPTIFNVTLHNAKIPLSIACSGTDLWMVGTSATKLKVNETTCPIDCSLRPSSAMVQYLPEHAFEYMEVDCSKLYDLDKIFVYLPNDDIHLYYNISEEESQISSVSVGFGSSSTTKQAPDLIGYEKATQSLFFRKHHTGFGNSAPFYIFIKVINRASFETIATYGPVIIDESRPSCAKPKVTVDYDQVTVSWEKDTFEDLDQHLDIGKIYHRVGNAFGFLTEFTEWNISDSPTSCQSMNTSCFAYKTNMLQRLNMDRYTPLYVSMHALNYAGHFCDVSSDDFYLPSISLPSKGVVFDVNIPVPDYGVVDIDFTSTLGQLCVYWEGFQHHEGLEFTVAVGTSPNIHDVIDYVTSSNENHHCFRDSKLQPYTKYFLVLNVTNSAGSIYVSSDGVTIINEQDYIDSMKVYDGLDCHTVTVMSEQNINLHLQPDDSTNFNISTPLHLGQQFSLHVDSNGDNYTIDSSDIITTIPTDNRSDLLFSPMANHPEMTLINTGSSILEIHKVEIRNCGIDLDIMAASSHLSLYWTVPKNLTVYVTHFEISFLRICNGNGCTKEIIPFFNAGKTVQYTISNHVGLEEGNYTFVVRPCFSSFCTKGVTSDGFAVQKNPPNAGSISAKITNIRSACNDIEIEFEPFECTSGQTASFYRWWISRDRNAGSILSDYVTLQPSRTTHNSIKDLQCLSLPVHAFHSMFVCLEGVCSSGMSSRECLSLTTNQHPNDFRKDVVFDLSRSLSFIDDIEKLKHSVNIGQRLKEIALSEMDVADSKVLINGFIQGQGHKNITWYLMKKQQISNITCHLDPECVIATQTFGGFVSFPKVTLTDETIYYTCAFSPAITIAFEKHSEDYPELNICSDGFLIDDRAPSKGEVTIHSSASGYVSGHSVSVSWTEFHDSTLYRTIGYSSAIALYEYGIGSQVEYDNVRPYSSAGLSNAIIIHDINLKPGESYYGLVRATDHFGHTSTAHSEPFIFDNTPPTNGSITIGHFLTHHYYVSSDDIIVHISDFHDDESGIKVISFGIGSSPETADVVAMSETTGGRIEILNNGMFADGHHYYVIVTVTNHAGLTSKFVSDVFYVDASPPTIGSVREGRDTDKVNFIYTPNTTHLECHWIDFYDHHSKIESYQVQLSTAADTEIDFIDVGLRTSWTWTYGLQPGKKYTVKVKACNKAGLCSIGSSKGVVVDGSAPVVGLVHVGRAGSHSKYIGSKSYLETQWYGFEDPQSGIQHYEICVGTNKGSCDIVPYTNSLTNSYFSYTGLSLPINKNLYLTVKATNNAGLTSETSSDTFIVDDTPPSVAMATSFDPSVHITKYGESQWDPSQLALKWRFSDNISPIVTHFVTLHPHHETHTDMGHFELGSEQYLHFTMKAENILREGDKYTASVIGCNAAGLCSQESKDNIMIDHTPPHIGQFDFPILWSNSEMVVLLQWKGFIDTESKIKHYFIGIGSAYHNSDISDGNIKFHHNGTQNTTQHGNVSISRSLILGENIVLSIIAENNVGLQTRIARITAKVVSTKVNNAEGELSLIKHSCDVEFCNNDCTCAKAGHKCMDVLSVSCYDLTGSNVPLPSVTVHMGLGNSHQQNSASRSCLSAHWKVDTNTTGKSILRYEWSFGLFNTTEGSGIFEINEPHWYDIGTESSVVHCLPRTKLLRHGHRYVAYIRAWFSQSQYAKYVSNPVTIDTTPPSIRRGKFIKDSDMRCLVDYEYLTASDTVTACWENVFSDPQSGIRNYKVFIGTHPRADDCIKLEDMGTSTVKTFSGLSMVPGTRYYITVEAVNGAGQITTYSSDGFTVDMDKPITGVVYTTKSYHDLRWISSESEMSASWHGFLDLHSYVHSYKVALAVNDASKSLVTSGYEDAYFFNTHTFRNLNLQQGGEYIVLVKVIDSAGIESDAVSSLPFGVDTSPPESFSCPSEALVAGSSDVDVINGTFNWTHSLSMDDKSYYRIHVSVYGLNAKSMVYFKIENRIQSLPLKQTYNGRYVSDLNFHSSFSGLHDVTIATVDGYKFTVGNGKAEIFVYKCMSKQMGNSEVVVMKQISFNQIAVEIKVHDPESGIKWLSLGVGTTRRGFQVRPLMKRTALNHVVVPVDRPHGAPLFATVIAENHAGLWSNFSSSSAIVLDHTSPLISNDKVSVQYIGDSSHGLYYIRVSVNWTVQEEESELQFCFCSFGTEKSSKNLQSSTNKTTESTCLSDIMEVFHGMTIYSTIICINTIELQSHRYVDPVIVSYNTPNTSASSVTFTVNSVKLHDQSQAQRITSTLQFYWDYFHDVSGMRSYKCRVRSGQTVISDWQDVGPHNYYGLDDLTLVDGMNYTAEVVGVNSGGHQSDVISASISITEIIPALTGNETEIVPTSSTDQKIVSWKNVFDLNMSLLPSFTVTLGSAEGYSDIARNVKTEEFEHRFSINDSLRELYVVITCKYITGTEAFYREAKKL